MYRTGFCHGDVIISLPCLLSAFFFLNNIPPRGNFGTIRKWRQQRGEGRGRDKRKKQKKKIWVTTPPWIQQIGLGVL
jgi:hypothetical protein